MVEKIKEKMKIIKIKEKDFCETMKSNLETLDTKEETKFVKDYKDNKFDKNTLGNSFKNLELMNKIYTKKI